MRTVDLKILSLLALGLIGSGCSDTPASSVDAGRDASVDISVADTRGEALAPDGPVTDSQPPDLGPVPALSWITVQPGSFTMGSPRSDICREQDVVKETQHKVTLSRAFRMSRYEVTQKQFQALMWYNPSKLTKCGPTCPVEMVNWHEAAGYCNALSRKEGLTPCYACTGAGPHIICGESSTHGGSKIFDCPGYRLPTEAEWEYAYRAGTTTTLYDGEISSCKDACSTADKIGWYKKNAGDTSHPVGQKQPNAWGLYDMAGNVWEWCHDWLQVDLGSAAVTDPVVTTTHSYRMIRSGAWFGFVENLRASHRFQKAPTYRCHGIGVRPVQTVKSQTSDAGPG